MTLVLDHVSVQVPAQAAMIAMLRDRLGLITTRTPAAPDRHGRVYLDRSYLEIAAGTEASLPFFFLRYDRLDHTLDALRGRGLRVRAGLYQGLDGIWEEIELDAGTAAPLPFLIRRTTPPEVARDWPPPLASPHPCGAEALAAVHLRVPGLEPALETYERLLGSPAMTAGAGGAVHPVGSGRIVFREAAGISPAIIGFELRVASLEQTRQHLSALGTKTWRADGALWTDLPGGGRLGFCTAGGPR
jgi:hypothetical protein